MSTKEDSDEDENDKTLDGNFEDEETGKEDVEEIHKTPQSLSNLIAAPNSLKRKHQKSRHPGE